MDYSELSDKAAENMRLALPLMKKHGVPMTPDNYAVWYEHVSGSNIELSSAISSLIKENPVLTQLQCKSLFKQFFNVEKERTEVMEIRQELARLLKEIANFVYSSVNIADKTNQQLNTILADINRDLSAEEIHQVVDDIVAATRSVMTGTDLLSERLNAAVVDVQNLKKEMDATKRESKIDVLTGLANRRSFDDVISKVTKDADSSGLDVCLIFCDIDLFRNINDQHGYLVGDQVLRVVANTLKDSVKGRDLVARYGGEEFSIVLLNTSLQHAKNLAENIRKEIASKRVQRKDTREALGMITLSFGTARYEKQEGVESFMQRADRALYMSKRKGRNCVSEAPPPII